MIRLESVAARVGGFVLDGVSLEVPAGGYGLVIGPTGSGKTTLLEAIAGHLALRGGRVHLDGRDVTELRPEARGVGFVYQHYHLFPHLSVEENIAYGLTRTDPGARRARIGELAEILGLGDTLGRRIAGLSGGEQQRVALARALAPRPRILLLDEPFAAVDPATRRRLRRELHGLHAREGVTTLQVTHDFEDAMRLGDMVAVLAGGRVAQAGTPEAVFRFPNSPFVADFIGTGNVLKGTVVRSDPGASRGEVAGEGARFPGRFRSGALELEVAAEREGESYAVLRPADLLVSREAIGPLPRNRFAGRIVRVEAGAAVAHLHLEVLGVSLVAAVMATTAEEARFAPGDAVHVAIKATAVHLI